MQVRLFLILLIIHQILAVPAGSKKKHSGKKAYRKPQAARKPVIEDIADTYSWDVFPSTAEYMETLYRAYEMTGSFYSGMDLLHKQLLYDRKTFRSKFFVVSEQDDSIMGISNVGGTYLMKSAVKRYLLKFFRNNLEELLMQQHPSLAVYEIVAELYKLIDSMSYILELGSRLGVKLTSHHAQELASMSQTNDRTEYFMRNAQKKYEPLLENGDHAHSHDVKKYLERRPVMTEFFKELKERRDFIEKNSIKSDMLIPISQTLVAVDMTNSDLIESSIDHATMQLRATINDISAHFAHQDMLIPVEDIIMLLRIYRILIPLVSGNEEFMSHLKTLKFTRDPKLMNEFIQKTSKHYNLVKHASEATVPDESFFSRMLKRSNSHHPALMSTSNRFRVTQIERMAMTMIFRTDFVNDITNAAMNPSERQVDAFQSGYIKMASSLDSDINDLLKPVKLPIDLRTIDENDQGVSVEDILIELPRMDSFEFSKENIIDADEILDSNQDEIVSDEADIEFKAPITKEPNPKTLNPYKNELCKHLDSYKRASFIYNEPDFFLEEPEMVLDNHHFRTLCEITMLGGANVHWSDAVKLIKALGGKMIATTGSIERVYIPTQKSFWTTVHRPHKARLGTPVSRGLNVLFRKWGIEIGKFQLIE